MTPYPPPYPPEGFGPSPGMPGMPMPGMPPGPPPPPGYGPMPPPGFGYYGEPMGMPALAALIPAIVSAIPAIAGLFRRGPSSVNGYGEPGMPSGPLPPPPPGLGYYGEPMGMPALAALIPAIASALPAVVSALPAVAKLFSGPPGLGAYGEPVGLFFPSLLSKLFSRPSPPRPPPPPQPGLPPLPELFFSNRPQFCQTFCPPTGFPGAMPTAPSRRRRRRR
jgi:hypothetical protein